MSKFYEINDLLSLSNYSKKYKISLKKIYRYVSDEIIEHYVIDGVAFLRDKHIPILKRKHFRNELQNDVKNLTKCSVSVQTLTLKNNGEMKSPDNQYNYNVKNLTKKNKVNVKFLTLTKNDLELMIKREETLSITEMEKRIKLIKKYLG